MCVMNFAVILLNFQVLDVYAGPNGFLRDRSCVRPWLFIDSSTIDPQTSRKLSASVSSYPLKEQKGVVRCCMVYDLFIDDAWVWKSTIRMVN